jgi:hypothetical protein
MESKKNSRRNSKSGGNTPGPETPPPSYNTHVGWVQTQEAAERIRKATGQRIKLTTHSMLGRKKKRNGKKSSVRGKKNSRSGSKSKSRSKNFKNKGKKYKLRSKHLKNKGNKSKKIGRMMSAVSSMRGGTAAAMGVRTWDQHPLAFRFVHPFEYRKDKKRRKAYKRNREEYYQQQVKEHEALRQTENKIKKKLTEVYEILVSKYRDNNIPSDKFICNFDIGVHGGKCLERSYLSAILGSCTGDDETCSFKFNTKPADPRRINNSLYWIQRFIEDFNDKSEEEQRINILENSAEEIAQHIIDHGPGDIYK